MTVLWLAGTGAAWLGLRHETNEVLDSALEETAQRLLVLPEAALGGEDGDPLAAEVGSHEEHVVYQVFDARGRLRLRSHQAPQEPLAPAAAEGLIDGSGRRIAALTRDDGRRRVLVAEDAEHRRRSLAATGAWMLLPLAVLLPLSALALHVSLRSGFGRLDRAREALLQRAAAADLRPLPPGDTPLELQPLIDTLNALLARMRDLLEAERLFAARSAHELRTPLAAARAQAQRLIAATHDAAARTHGERLLAQLDRLAALSSRLLQLARLESGIALRRERVDLAQLAALVIDEFRALPDAARLALVVDAPAATVQGDLDALAIALRNLIDNALKHGGPRARVQVRVGAASVAVIDDGPGADAATLERLKRPYERGSASAEGAGLGLSMVESIARQSGATFELRSPAAQGRGLAATLRFGAG
ncbi:MAG TPA: ATP-binding protein [Burkholderiaceae bacterium]|nr:ATP-binding protein [Burkholderiaceae bacterium]